MPKSQNKNNQNVDEWWEREQQMKKLTGKWYDNNFLVLFFCIVFFPIGLYGLWKSKFISTGLKVVGTFLILIVLIAFFNSNDTVLEHTIQDTSQDLSEDHIQREIELTPTEMVNRFNEALSLVGKDYQLYLKEYFFETEDRISYVALPEGEEFMRLLIYTDRSTEQIMVVDVYHDTSLLSDPSKTLDDHLVAAILTIEGLDVESDEIETIYGQLTDFVEGTEGLGTMNVIDRNGFRFAYGESGRRGPLGSNVQFGPIQRNQF
jgi:hypothetical protein